MKLRFLFLQLIAISSFSTLAAARPTLQIESGATFQSRNEARIPGDTGTLFKITDFSKGPVVPVRIDAKYSFGTQKKHALRVLWAPLKLSTEGKLGAVTSFAGKSFNVTDNTEALYKFNSYRLSYLYNFDAIGAWYLSLGFTAKIRDAEIRLTQNGIKGSKKNVGFVPLLRFEALRIFDENWALAIDLDGLAAPQGRAFDLGVFLQRQIANFGAGHRASIIAGYRTVEGGADNDVVYNFAWFHTAVLGLKAEF